jgi:hypothetical protein
MSAFATADFPGAYLNAKLKKRHSIRIQPETAAITVEIDPTAAMARCKDISMLVELKKTLHALPESGRLWYEKLQLTLIPSKYSAHLLEHAGLEPGTLRIENISEP